MEEIFHPPNLILSADVIPNDQLIRGVLAANATGGSFDRFVLSVMQGGGLSCSQATLSFHSRRIAMGSKAMEST